MPTSPTWDELNGNDPQSTITQVFPEEAPMPPNAPLPTQFRGRSRSSDEEAMTLTQELMEEWSPPDPGFNQREYSDSELEEDESNLNDIPEEQSPPRNPFIDDEAEVAWDAEGETAQPEDEESDPDDCVVVAHLTEDESNAIEDLEYLIDFDNWFSDDEFVNRIKRAKTRRMEIVSDSESE